MTSVTSQYYNHDATDKIYCVQSHLPLMRNRQTPFRLVRRPSRIPHHRRQSRRFSDVLPVGIAVGITIVLALHRDAHVWSIDAWFSAPEKVGNLPRPTVLLSLRDKQEKRRIAFIPSTLGFKLFMAVLSAPPQNAPKPC